MLLCFYSSDLCNPIKDMLFSSVSKLDNNIYILCIDIHYFDNIGRRFGITEIPTTILIKNAREKQRFIGNLLKKDLDVILTGIQTNEN
jgi:thioredoxin-like negative regulator of GroEL